MGDPSSANTKFQKGHQQSDLQTDLYLGSTVTHENRVWLMNGITRSSEQTFNPATAPSVTQPIENLQSLFKHVSRRVTRWRSGAMASAGP